MARLREDQMSDKRNSEYPICEGSNQAVPVGRWMKIGDCMTRWIDYECPVCHASISMRKDGNRRVHTRRPKAGETVVVVHFTRKRIYAIGATNA